MVSTSSSPEKLLQQFLVDYDNCKDIEERLANSPKEIAWRQLLTGTWHWERLKECSYDENKLKVNLLGLKIYRIKCTVICY